MTTFSDTEIDGMLLVEPRVFSDPRGYNMETFQKVRFAEAGISADFVQDNHSGSRCGILRGLHYQIQQAQGKLVRVVVGEVYDVGVDLRRGSPTFGKWAGYLLSAENKRQLWLPPGLAHGFLVLSDWAEVIYKVTDFYAPQWERTLLWNDPQLGIDWHLPAGAAPVLSTKDAAGMLFKDADLYD